MSCTATHTLRSNARLIIRRLWNRRHSLPTRIAIRYWIGVAHQVRVERSRRSA